jgi:hypothetical protein
VTPAHEKLTNASKRGDAKAETHLAALERAYGRALRAAGRRSARAFRVAAEPLTASVDAKWTPSPTDAILNKPALEADTEKKTRKLHRLMLTSSAQTALEPFGISFDITAPTSQALLDAVGKRIQDGIASAIEEQIVNAIKDGYANGDSVARVAAKIEQTTDEISRPRAAALARTDLNALSNGGSLLAASVSGAAPYKVWIATEDSVTRETHSEADGQVVPIDGVFTVGGEECQYPGDPDLSDDESINCRCALGYADSMTASAAPRVALPRDFASWLDHQWEGDPTVIVASDGPDVSNLAMIAVYPALSEAEAIALDDGQDAEGMHVTLVFLGDADSFDADVAREAVADVAAAHPVLSGTVGGLGMFAPGPDGAPLIALPDVDGLTALREAVVQALAARGIVSPSEHGFLPHMTIDYRPIDDNVASTEIPWLDLDCLGQPLTFSSLSLTIAENRSDYRLGASPTDAVTSGGNMAATKSKFTKISEEISAERSMTLEAASEALTAEFEAAAAARLAAVRARLTENDADVFGDDELRAMILTFEALGFNPAVQAHAYQGAGGSPCEMCGLPLSAACHGVVASAELTEFTLTAADQGSTQWQATLCVEGEPTVDSGTKRLLAEGAISFLPLPLPLAIMDDSSHADVVMSAPVCGRIDQIWKAGNKWQAAGIFMDASADASVREMGARAAALVGEKMITGISVDLVDAEVEMMVYTPNGTDSPQELGDQIRDGGTSEYNLPEDIPEADVIESAEPDDLEYVLVFTSAKIAGATICPSQALTDATIAVVAGAEGKMTWRSETAWHLPSLTAAAAGMVPVEPPAEWFTEPEHDGPTPLTVTDDGQVYGHLALWGTCHTGKPGVCVTPPHSPSAYRNFHRGELKTAEGERVDVGVLTMNTGHAGLRLNAAATVAHYDDTGTVAAHVRASDGAYGIWLAGALNPKLSAEDARVLMAAPPSGDWRELNRGEGLDLFAALAVNVQGFPVPRPAARLVASGDEMERVALVAAGRFEVAVSDEAYARKLAVLAASADGIQGLASLVA